MLRKKFKIKLFYGNKGKNIFSCAKDLSMGIETYCNECVSNRNLEKQDKFPLDKSVHHFIRFHLSNINSNERGNQAV